MTGIFEIFACLLGLIALVEIGQTVLARRSQAKEEQCLNTREFHRIKATALANKTRQAVKGAGIHDIQDKESNATTATLNPDEADAMTRSPRPTAQVHQFPRPSSSNRQAHRAEPARRHANQQ